MSEKITKSMATDLRKVAESAEQERLERERAAQARRVVAVQRWDRRMQRTFKGILTRRDRHRMIFEVQQRELEDA